ncbi:hypothetical protein [Namhaeicola litoreus]|uniref:Uncharacterized protein n=1 Tax=Namhaeicola litoreus TaxID=1052145 RepID=A0ABW3Y269_9FLAO
MKTNLIYQTALGSIILLSIQWMIGVLTGSAFGIEKAPWLFFSDVLVVLLLAMIARNNRYESEKLIAIIFSIFFAIGSFNILVEAFIFNVTDRSETIRQIGVNAIEMALFSFVFVKYIIKKSGTHQAGFNKRKLMGWIWRIVTGNFMYLVFYLLAGAVLYLSYPKLNEFYGDKIPPMDLIIKTQLFLRGFVFIAVAILIDRTVNLPKYKKAILVGLVFSIIGGIAPLIVPNDAMPQFVRIAHGFEVGISNFIYGFIMSILFYQSFLRTDHIEDQNYPKEIGLNEVL